MTDDSPAFGVSIGEMFRVGVTGYLKHVAPLSAAAAATLGIYLAFRFPAQAAFEDGAIVRSIAFDLVGLVVSSVAAYPWYSYALDAERGRGIDVGRPFEHSARFKAQAVASFWFWAAVLLGLRYLLGIPSILAVLFYAFYGYVVADGAASGGLTALGTSVRIGQGRRVGLFAIAALLLVFNMFGAISVGFAVNPFTIALAFVGVVVTSSVTMVAGAHVYRTLQSEVKA